MGQFRANLGNTPLDIIAGGDRNFKTGSHEYESSNGGSWHPGGAMLSEWSSFLESIGCYEVPQPTFTYRRTGRNRDGSAFYLRETIDFVAVSLDPLEFSGVKCASVCRDDVPHSLASDHLPVQVRVVEKFAQGRAAASGLGRRTKPIPEWIFDNSQFREYYFSKLGVGGYSQKRVAGLTRIRRYHTRGRRRLVEHSSRRGIIPWP